MPMELLQQLAERRLPCVIESPAEVDQLRVLRAAGLVVAMFLRPPGTQEQQAEVLAITPQGRQALGLAGHQPSAELRAMPRKFMANSASCSTSTA